ncbi:MAG: hypothetical protein ACOYYI_17710 [Chloroflexota bacterium]
MTTASSSNGRGFIAAYGSLRLFSEQLPALHSTILACCGWGDLELKHDFYQNERGQTRFMPSAEARREVVFRLVELNAKMAREETIQ